MLFSESHREMDGIRISFLCQTVDVRAARIGIAHHTGDLIEGFSGRIIARLSQKLEGVVILHDNDHRVAAGDDKRKKWRFQIRILKKIRKDMPFHMVDCDQRFSECPCRRFRRCDTDQQCAHESRPLRHGDGIYILPA